MSLVHASRTTTIAALATALLLLPGLLGVAAANHGSPVDAAMCGTTITSNTTLTHDVGPCPGDGLIIGASNITLDLNGHDVFGLEGSPQATGTGAGILIDGPSGVTVTDGSTAGGSEVRDFDGGVVIRGGGSNTVKDLHIHRNQGEVSTFWFLLPPGVDAWGEGVAVWSSTNNTVQDNTVHDNGPNAGIGIYGSDGNTVQGNTVTDHDYEVEPVFANQNIGIRVGPSSKTNTIDDNTVTGSALDGVTVFSGSTGNVISDNTLSDNTRDGARLFRYADSNTVKDNRMCGNGQHGLFVQTNATANTLSGNTAGDGSAGCPTNTSTDLVDEHGPPCTVNTWSGNAYTTKDPSCIS